MNKYFIMQPRQSGKTQKAIYEYLKNPEDSLFICHNKACFDYIKELSYANIENICTSSQYIKNVKYSKFKNLILDEYLYFEDYRELTEAIKANSNIENIYIFSTPVKIYKTESYQFVLMYKTGRSFNELCNLFKYQFNCNIDTTLSNELSELYYNFLTDGDCKIININFRNRDLNEHYKKFCSVDSDKYMMEVNCMFIDCFKNVKS